VIEPTPSGNYVVAYTTFDSHAEALQMAHELVERSLVACAQIHEITSVYRWKEHVEEVGEFILTMKTTAAGVEALKSRILANHSYEVPEFLVVPVIAGHDRYLSWIAGNVGEADPR
jgi:periplasmic divalent cation tolerance protein